MPLNTLKSTARRLTICVGTIAMLGACAYFVAGLARERHRLGFVPTGLGVTGVRYAKEDSWGFGPGGNETGVIAYALPVPTATAIQNQGIRYLQDLPPETLANGLGRAHSWQTTPAQLEGSDAHANSVFSFDVADYLNRYGFGIDIDPTVRQQINDALANDGSFLSHERTGILIVAPSLQKVFYIYNG
ncbi:hypothetical protein [Variovorax boronicumulans]